MVRVKIELFKYLDYLDKVSDKCCENNGKKYIDFDKNSSNLSSVDCLIIEDIKNYIVLIEFKNFSDLNRNGVNDWLSKKENIQQILLKGYESYFQIKKLFDKYEINFENVEKRFILVYKVNESKKRIKEHFKNKLNRLKIAFNEVIVVECKNFLNLLQRIDNVF